MLLFIASLIFPCVYLLLEFFSFAAIYTNLLEERCLFPESLSFIWQPLTTRIVLRADNFEKSKLWRLEFKN